MDPSIFFVFEKNYLTIEEFEEKANKVKRIEQLEEEKEEKMEDDVSGERP